ncbi:MAG: radical SAM/SPASM domain protein, ACGX system [Bacteroidales bacterium]|nr:radical SAM/SPASM domain protein, ACGX system [Bacteroidales bacterium]
MPAPLAFQWHITEKCDLRCKHCYIYAAGNKEQEEMPWDKLMMTLDKVEVMCENMKRTPFIYITGGDPLLHPRFWDFLSLLNSKKIQFSIMGNPYHLDDEVCHDLKVFGCQQFQLSLDGLKEKHDSLRREGSFDATLNAIPIIRKAGIKCAIMSTVSGYNIDDIPELIKVVVEHYADVYAFARYCPTDGNKDKWHIEPRVYRDFLDKCWHVMKKYKDLPIAFPFKDHLWTLYMYEKKNWFVPDGLDEFGIYDGCHCAQSHLTISADGNLMACRRFDSVVGDVYYDFDYVWHSKKMNFYRHYGAFEKCKKCILLRFCRGCPAVAYGYHKDYYAPDPQCWR